MNTGASVCASCQATRVLDTMGFVGGALKTVMVLAIVGLAVSVPFTGLSFVTFILAAAGAGAFLLWRPMRVPVYVKKKS